MSSYCEKDDFIKSAEKAQNHVQHQQTKENLELLKKKKNLKHLSGAGTEMRKTLIQKCPVSYLKLKL